MNHNALMDLIEIEARNLKAARRQGFTEALAVTERIRVLALRLTLARPDTPKEG